MQVQITFPDAISPDFIIKKIEGSVADQNYHCTCTHTDTVNNHHLFTVTTEKAEAFIFVGMAMGIIIQQYNKYLNEPKS